MAKVKLGKETPAQLKAALRAASLHIQELSDARGEIFQENEELRTKNSQLHAKISEMNFIFEMDKQLADIKLEQAYIAQLEAEYNLKISTKRKDSFN